MLCLSPCSRRRLYRSKTQKDWHHKPGLSRASVRSLADGIIGSKARDFSEVYAHTPREFSIYMSLIEELLEGRFQLPCSEIRLTREKGDPIEIAGPGVIGLNAKGKFEYSINVSVADHALIYDFGWKSLRPPGSLFPPESYFRLKATSSSEGIWSGQALLPQAASGEEIVRGTLSELVSEQDEAPAEFDRATMFVPTKLSFPTLHRTRSDGGISYDHTEFPIDSENFTFYHRNSFTELECRLEPGSISKNRHRRLQEAT